MEQNTIIKEVCKELGLTQKELASKIGVNPKTVYKWTDNSNKIPDYFYKSVEMLKKINTLES